MAKFNLTNFFSDTLQKFGSKNNPKAAQLKSGGAKAKFGANPNRLFKKYMVLTELNTVNDLAGQTGNLANWDPANISAATYSSSAVMLAAQKPKYIALGKSNQG
jgi:hypothetical protein